MSVPSFEETLRRVEALPDLTAAIRAEVAHVRWLFDAAETAEDFGPLCDLAKLVVERAVNLPFSKAGHAAYFTAKAALYQLSAGRRLSAELTGWALARLRDAEEALR